MVRSCCVPNCNSGLNVPSHKFPKNHERCSEWIESLNLHHFKNYCANELQKHKVCYKHFSETDYSCSLHHRFLLNTAIPVPFITNNNMDTTSNLQQQSSQQQYILQENENVQQCYQNLRSVHNRNMLPDQVEHLEQELLMECNAGQIEVPNQIEQQQENSTNEHQPLCIYENVTNKETENIIQDHENCLQKLEEQIETLVTTPRKSIKRRRLNVQKISRIGNLTPTARKLYDNNKIKTTK